MNKKSTIKFALSLLPIALTVALFSAFRSNNSMIGGTSEFASSAGGLNKITFNYSSAVAAAPTGDTLDDSKRLIHLVWERSDTLDKIERFVIERSVNHGKYAPVTAANFRAITNIHLLPKTAFPNYNTILYSSEKTPYGSYIYNEVYTNEEFSHIDFRYRLRVEYVGGQIAYSEVVGNRKNDKSYFFNHQVHSEITNEDIVYATEHSDEDKSNSESAYVRMMAACPATQSNVTGCGTISSTAGIPCDCGTYTTRENEAPCTASPPNPYKLMGISLPDCGDWTYNGSHFTSDCVCACFCQYDDCCQHKCPDYLTCGCYPWKACQTWTPITYTVAKTGTPITASNAVTNCTTACNGKINLTAGGGDGSLPGLTYSWTGPNGFTSTVQDPASLCDGGTYTVVITDPGPSTNCTFTISTSITGCLPINLAKFTAFKKDKVVLLSWATASEVDNDYFTLERSGDGNYFTPIKVVDGAGNSSTMKYYNEIDNDPLQGYSYYRLKQTDTDGKFTYSPVESLFFNVNELISIAPNPTRGQVEVIFPAENEDVEVTIVDSRGRNVFKKKFEKVAGMYKANADLTNYDSGIYYVTIAGKSGNIIRKIVKY